MGGTTHPHLNRHRLNAAAMGTIARGTKGNGHPFKAVVRRELVDVLDLDHNADLTQLMAAKMTGQVTDAHQVTLTGRAMLGKGMYRREL